MILPAASIWGQFASFWFFCAAIFGDILLIRLFLTLAYIFLLIAACLGYPSWVTGYRGQALDGIIWAALSGSLHAVALTRLLLDERSIKFATEDEEQLYRFFYRRSGMKRLEFQQVLRRGHWMKVKANTTILTPIEASRTLCLLVEGVASFRNVFPDPETGEKRKSKDVFLSGSFFDKRLLNCFGLYVGFEHGKHLKRFAVKADTDCLLYMWSIEQLNIMATQCGPAVSSYWRNCIATILGLEYGNFVQKDVARLCGTGNYEDPPFLKGARSRDFTDPPRSYEQPRVHSRLKMIGRWLVRSLHPLMPPGIRHNDLPVTGILARNRVLALKEAEIRLALAEYQDEDVSVRAGQEAARFLQQQVSLRKLEATDIAELAVNVTRSSIDGRRSPTAACVERNQNVLGAATAANVSSIS